MKNTFLQFLLIAALSACFTTYTSAQCIPNNDTVAGIEPDTLSTAYVGVPYEQIIYFKLPLDTSVQFGPFTVALIIDSLVIDSYTGLPPSFSLACNSPSCTLLGGQNGCAAITGTATDDEAGYHPLNVYVTTYVSDTFGTPVGGFPDTIDFYFLDVQFATGVADAAPLTWNMGAFYPNPSDEELFIPFTSPLNSTADYSVTDISGRVMKYEKTVIKKGHNTLSMSIADLPDGCYFIRIRTPDYVAAEKFQVLH